MTFLKSSPALPKERLLGHPVPKHSAPAGEELLLCTQVPLSGQALRRAKHHPGHGGHLQGTGRWSPAPYRCCPWSIKDQPGQALTAGFSTRMWEERKPLDSTSDQGSPQDQYGNHLHPCHPEEARGTDHQVPSLGARAVEHKISRCPVGGVQTLVGDNTHAPRNL